MKLKRAILDVMGHDLLEKAVERLGLADDMDKRRTDAMQARLSRTRRASPEVLIRMLHVADVRRVCEMQGLGTTGPKEVLIEAVLADESKPQRRARPKRSAASAPEGVADIFAVAGLPKPDSILSDEFLAEVRGLEHPNVSVELLRKLLDSEIATRRHENIVQARSFAEMLEEALGRYQNRAVEAAQVIEELIDLARSMRTANERGEALGLGTDELAFYDALETGDSTVQVLGDEKLRLIAWELVRTVRNNVDIDWTRRESVRAKLRAAVKRILNKHGYPPDKREKAAETVLEQAEALSASWAEERPPELGFRPFPKRGDGVVTEELIDRLREETGD